MQGVLLCAHDNEVVDYATLAVGCAEFIKRHLGVSISLITDSKTWESLERQWPDRADHFHKVEFVDEEENSVRTYFNKEGEIQRGVFHNRSRKQAFDLTPYDETMIVDVDYLVLGNSLNRVWGSDADIRMNVGIEDLGSCPAIKMTRKINPMSMDIHWATVFYFKKNNASERFFDLVNHVAENYEFYSATYRFKGVLYRNDFAFTIANHIMSGYSGESFVEPLPDDHTIFCWDQSKIIQLRDDSALFEIATLDPSLKFPVRVTGRDVHIMNKISLQERFREFLNEQ